MSDLLRQYAPEECVKEGYPLAWSLPTPVPTHRGVISEWYPAIKDLIREQAGHRCLRCGHPYRSGEHGNGEWSPCDERCSHGGPMGWFDGQNYYDGLAADVMDAMMQRVAQWRILTVHHLDEDKGNCRWWNLAALDQRCHLRMQRAVVMGRPYHYEHSEWFKPFAAGFYAFKYLGEDLTREETDARLDELLALEHRFTQEVLPI